MACDETPKADAPSSPAGAPSFAVTPPPASTIPASPEARAAERQRLFDRLMAIVTPEQQRVIRETFETNDGRFYAIAGNPEAAEILGRIYAIEDAEIDRRQLEWNRNAATRYRSPVTVALVDAFKSPRLEARVVRDPKLSPDNVVILSRASLSPETVTAAFAALSRSRLRHGGIAAKRMNLYVTAGAKVPPLSPDQRQWAESLIAQLQTAAPRDVPGLGSVPAVAITVGPVVLDQRGS